MEYETVEEFLANLSKEFGGREEGTVKVAELRRLEQERKTIKEFVQKFRRAARGSRYKKQLLVEEFKYSINKTIQ